MGKGFLRFFEKDIKGLLDGEAFFDAVDESGTCFSDDGEDGTFDWTHNCFVSSFFGGKEGFGEFFGVKGLLIFAAIGEAFEDLGGDDAGVSTGTHKEATAERLGDHGNGIVVLVVNFLRTRGKGKIHVHARVAIRDRENIELVDFWIVVIKVVSAR